MKAIVTRFHCPGNVRGSRVSAHDSDNNRVILHIDPAWRSDEIHKHAAVALCSKMGWKGTLAEGHLANGERVFVWVVPDTITEVR